jgi:hypothetical protein
MTLKTTIESLSRKDLLKLNRSLKFACSKLIGNSLTKIRTYKNNSKLHGEFDSYTLTIKIYRGSIKNVEKYVEVFIHEWTHSVQKDIKTKYDKMTEKYGYKKNPYEIEARKNEKVYRSNIWKVAKTIIKNGSN